MDTSNLTNIEEIFNTAYASKDYQIIKLISLKTNKSDELVQRAINDIDATLFQQLYNEGCLNLDKIKWTELNCKDLPQIAGIILSSLATQQNFKQFIETIAKIEQAHSNHEFLSDIIKQLGTTHKAFMIKLLQKQNIPPNTTLTPTVKSSSSYPQTSYPTSASTSKFYAPPSILKDSTNFSHKLNENVHFRKKRPADSSFKSHPTKKPPTNLEKYETLRKAIDTNDDLKVLGKMGYKNIQSFLQGPNGHEALIYAYENGKDNTLKVLLDYVNRDDINVVDFINTCMPSKHFSKT